MADEFEKLLADALDSIGTVPQVPRRSPESSFPVFGDPNTRFTNNPATVVGNALVGAIRGGYNTAVRGAGTMANILSGQPVTTDEMIQNVGVPTANMLAGGGVTRGLGSMGRAVPAAREAQWRAIDRNTGIANRERAQFGTLAEENARFGRMADRTAHDIRQAERAQQLQTPALPAPPYANRAPHIQPEAMPPASRPPAQGQIPLARTENPGDAAVIMEWLGPRLDKAASLNRMGDAPYLIAQAARMSGRTPQQIDEILARSGYAGVNRLRLDQAYGRGPGGAINPPPTPAYTDYIQRRNKRLE